MSLALFWRATDAYRLAEVNRWSAFKAFIDSRDDYSLAVWQLEIDALWGRLVDAYLRAVPPGDRLHVDDMTEASLNTIMSGRSAFEGVMAAPPSLVLYLDASLYDAWNEDWERHLDEL